MRGRGSPVAGSGGRAAGSGGMYPGFDLVFTWVKGASALPRSDAAACAFVLGYHCYENVSSDR